jgi:hypothetical protein
LELAHYGGIDELAIIWMPAVMGIGLWLIMRTGKDEQQSDEQQSEEDAEVSESEER